MNRVEKVLLRTKGRKAGTLAIVIGPMLAVWSALGLAGVPVHLDSTDLQVAPFGVALGTLTTLLGAAKLWHKPISRP